MPTADVLLARGKLYVRKILAESDEKSKWETGESAYKDFSNAIRLADSPELEKEARFARFRLVSQGWYGPEYDFDWLKAHTEGREYGEVLFLDVQAYFTGSGFYKHATELAETLSHSLQLGFTEAPVFYLRAEANIHLHNFGLALRDIDTAIEKTDQSPNPEFFETRGCILIQMGRYEEAYDSLSRSRQLSNEKYHAPLGWILPSYEDFLCRYGIAFELDAFRPHREDLIPAAKRMIQTLLAQTDEERILKQYPRIAIALRKVLSGEL